MGLLGEPSSVCLSLIHQLLIKLFLLCQLKSYFDETWYE